MNEIDRFRAPQVDSETFKILEKMLQTVESFGFEIRVFGFEILVFGFEIWVFGTKCWVFDTSCWVFGTKCWVFGTSCWVFGTQCWGFGSAVGEIPTCCVHPTLQGAQSSKGGFGSTGREPRMCSDEQGGLGSE